MLDQVFADLFPTQGLAVELVGVLCADQHGMNALRFAKGIFHSHLALAIRVHPLQRAVLAHFSHAAGQLVG